jgi:hypothetical protein
MPCVSAIFEGPRPFDTPAPRLWTLDGLKSAGWDETLQIRGDVYFTNGRIIIRGRLISSGKAMKADFVLYYMPNIPIAIIEGKEQQSRRWRRDARYGYVAARHARAAAAEAGDPWARVLLTPRSNRPALLCNGLAEHRYEI